MSTLTRPVIAFATMAAEPRAAAAGDAPERVTNVRATVAPRRSRPAAASASTEELLSQRDRLPAAHPDRAILRARAIEMNLPMASRLARRYAGRGEILEDLTQVAAMALIRAVDRYDPSRRIPFSGFATPSILGALKRHFRDATWAIRVPRPIQELALRVSPAVDELGRQLGRTPTTAELAAHLDVTVADALAAVGAWQQYRLQSLNTPHPDTGTDLIDALGDIDPRYDNVDAYVSLRSLVAQLPLRDRCILTMRFYEHMTQSQIAAEVGISQMHVSRLLKRSLTGLRAALL